MSSYFFSENELKQYGHRVLTSIADLGLEDPGLLRIVGYKLSNEGLLRQAAAVFQRVLRLREKEPQSWRDLGNVLADLGLYKRALECFHKVVIGEWDSKYVPHVLACFDLFSQLLGDRVDRVDGGEPRDRPGGAQEADGAQPH